MVSTYLFWALLALPGLWLVFRFAPAEAERGLLSALALGYAASLLALSPIALACYLLRLPAFAFSAAVVASIGLALFMLARPATLRALGRCFAPDLGLGALLLFFDLLLAARVGGWLDGDATVHVGRIRDLLDHGFSNHDIYLQMPYFSYAYHDNPAHALYAAATQLGSGDPLLTWFASLPWARLLLAAGHYHLAHTLTGKRWTSWLCALLVIASRAGETYTLYPNLLAVGWLWPTLLGVVLRAHAPGAARARSVAWLALGAFLISELHAMYWALAVLALLPLFGARALLAARSRRREAAFFAACAVALLSGAPMALVARFGGKWNAQQLEAAKAAVKVPIELPGAAPPAPHKPKHGDAARHGLGGHLEKQLEPRAGGGRALSLPAAGGAGFLLAGLAALALLAVWPAGPRAPVVALGAAAVTLCGLPLQPQLATLASHVLPDFGVARMITAGSSCLLVALGAVLARGVDRLTARPALQAVVTLLASAAATQLPAQAPRSFATHVRTALADRARREELLDMHRARRELLRAHLPPGTPLLATLREARYAVMVYDVRVVAADRAHGRVPKLLARRIHVQVMTAARTPWEVREVLLHHYRLRYVLYRAKHAARFRWAREHGKVLGRAGGLELCALE